MAFTKKHYEFLAAFIAYERSVSTGIGWSEDTERTKTIDGLARLLATRFEQDNPKFKRSIFLNACDVEDTHRIRRCDCESATCHPKANCEGSGTVKTIYSTICADCAKKMPAKYLKENEVV